MNKKGETAKEAATQSEQLPQTQQCLTVMSRYVVCALLPLQRQMKKKNS